MTLHKESFECCGERAFWILRVFAKLDDVIPKEQDAASLDELKWMNAVSALAELKKSSTADAFDQAMEMLKSGSFAARGGAVGAVLGLKYWGCHWVS